MRSSILLPVAFLVALASIFVIVFGLQGTAPILNPILLATVITIAVLPLSHWLMQRGLKPWLALAITVLIVVGGILGVLVLFGYGIAGLSARVPEYAQNIGDQANVLWSQLDQAGATLPDAPQSSEVSRVLESLVDSFANVAVVIFTTLLIFVFLLAGSIATATSSNRSLQIQQSTIRQINNLTTDVRKYVNVTTVLTLLAGVLNTILLVIVGVDFALLWGVLSWLLGYIPAIGFWLALIPPTILAWVELGVPSAIVVFAGFVIINGFTDNILAPKFQGDSLNISPVVVMLSLIIWGWTLGAIGAILAIPMTLLVLTIMDQFEATRGLAALMRTSPGSGDEKDDQDAQKSKGRDQLRRWWESITAGDPSVSEDTSATLP